MNFDQARHLVRSSPNGVGELIFADVYVPRGLWTRARGLIGRPPLSLGAAWYFGRCNAIHMIGMRYAIDVFFLDGSGRVLRVIESLRPWRAARCPAAESVVEAGAGAAKRLRIRVNDTLELR